MGWAYVVLAIGWLLVTGPASVATTYYVNASGSGGDGTTWPTAFTNLQQALSPAGSDDQIWVAQGTYYPTNGMDRTASFRLKTGISVYGGFTNGMTVLAERNWTSNIARLDGDIGVAGVSNDNSLHVLTGTNNTVLDGFTIQNGCADGATGAAGSGGGLYNVSSNLTIRNCSFVSNVCNIFGGALYNTGKNLLLSNCTFAVNSSTNVAKGGPGGGAAGGGGLYNTGASNMVFRCVFLNNLSTANGGAISDTSGSLWIDQCRFVTNSGGIYGGAMYAYSPTIVNSIFIDNGGATVGGGAIINLGSSVTFISNCVFAGNSIPSSGLGTTIYVTGPALIARCVFSGNGGEGTTQPTIFSRSSLNFSNCVFSGNRCWYIYGPCIYVDSGYGVQALTIKNSIFIGNASFSMSYPCPTAIYSGSQTSVVENCTFARNRGGMVSYFVGDVIKNGAGFMTAKNSVMWSNSWSKTQFYAGDGASSSTVSYCDFQNWPDSSSVSGAVFDAGGMLNTNPLFGDTVTGLWSSAATYDPAAGQTLLTDTTKNWGNGQLIGQFVNPAVTQPLCYAVFSNTANTVLVWGNAAALAADAYQIYDCRLRQGSPCINNGANSEWMDNAADLDGHRRIDRFSGRVDMGAYEHLLSGALFSFH